MRTPLHRFIVFDTFIWNSKTSTTDCVLRCLLFSYRHLQGPNHERYSSWRSIARAASFVVRNASRFPLTSERLSSIRAKRSQPWSVSWAAFVVLPAMKTIVFSPAKNYSRFEVIKQTHAIDFPLSRHYYCNKTYQKQQARNHLPCSRNRQLAIKGCYYTFAGKRTSRKKRGEVILERIVSIVMSLPCRLKLKLVSYNCHVLLRVSVNGCHRLLIWMIMSRQQVCNCMGYNSSCNCKSNFAQPFVESFVAVVK